MDFDLDQAEQNCIIFIYCCCCYDKSETKDDTIKWKKIGLSTVDSVNTESIGVTQLTKICVEITSEECR